VAADSATGVRAGDHGLGLAGAVAYMRYAHMRSCKPGPNYRSQFQAIMANGGIDHLLELLREKNASGEGLKS
jgi:hypothetical protein